MKVGILTYHHVPNYGSLLQAYALSETIKKQGHEVEFINYQPYKALIYYSKNSYLNSNFLSYAVKCHKMKQFISSNIEVSRITYYFERCLKNFDWPYDLVICGSDEIWNINSIRKFDSSYFLDFIGNKNIYKASYASSFGWTNKLGSYYKTVQKSIQTFDFISVRDSNSLQIIKQECGREAIKVLDPTFLADYSKIISTPKLKQYALIYVNGRLRQKEKDYIKAIAKSKDLILISVGYYHGIAEQNFLTIDPGEWLGYFSKASYIFTNCYHGTIFSTIFKKPFLVLPRQNKINKINDLLEDIGLENRILNNTKFDGCNTYRQHLTLDIDYSSVDDKLLSRIFTSCQYLSGVLSDKN